MCQVLRHIEYVQLLKSISWISPFCRMLYKDNVVYNRTELSVKVSVTFHYVLNTIIRISLCPYC